MSEYAFLLPEPDAETAPYWEAAKRHELVVQRCADCDALRHPPRVICPYCLGERSAWQRVSGRGKIYTFVRIAHAVLPQWRSRTPYNVAQIALDEDPRMRIVGNIVDSVGEPQHLECGLAVEVVFDDVVEGVSIPRWRLLEP